jgi:hypothetical protein
MAHGKNCLTGGSSQVAARRGSRMDVGQALFIRVAVSIPGRHAEPFWYC